MDDNQQKNSYQIQESFQINATFEETPNSVDRLKVSNLCVTFEQDGTALVSADIKIRFQGGLERSEEVSQMITLLLNCNKERVFNAALEPLVREQLGKTLPQIEAKTVKVEKVNLSFCQDFEIELKEPIYYEPKDGGFTEKELAEWRAENGPDKTTDTEVFDFNNKIEYQKVLNVVNSWKNDGRQWQEYHQDNSNEIDKVLNFEYYKTSFSDIDEKFEAYLGKSTKESKTATQKVENKQNTVVISDKGAAKNKKETNFFRKIAEFLSSKAGVFKKILKTVLILALCGGLVLGVLLAIDGIGNCLSSCNWSCSGCNLGCNGCGRNIKHLKIKEGTTVIKEREYSGYPELLTVEIPASVEVIEEGAFRYCDKLHQVTFAENSKLKEIGQEAFGGCFSLTTIELPNGLQKIDSYAFSCSALTEITIPNSVEIIGDYAFEQNENLTQITFGNGLKTIGTGAFCCDNNLTSVILPESLTSICRHSFEVYESESNVGVTYNEYQGVKYLPSATNPYFAAMMISDMQMTTVSLHPDTKIISNYFSSKNGYFVNGYFDMNISDSPLIKEVILPEGLKVIGGSAFEKRENVEKINIPNSVEYIEWKAFYKCGKENSVLSFPQDSQLKYLGEQAFADCKGLTHVTIPAGISGGKESFARSSITSLKIKGLPSEDDPNALEGAFDSCDKLQYVIIPENYYFSRYELGLNTYIFCEGIYGGRKNVKTIRFKREKGEVTVYQIEGSGEIIIPSVIDGLPVTVLDEDVRYEFFNVESKIQLTLPASLTFIESGLIDGAYVNEVRFEEGATAIIRNAFTGKGIERLVLPSTLQAVNTGDLPFYSDLKSIYFNGTKETWDSIVDEYFESSYNKTTVYFYSEVKPENKGNYWYYKDGVITLW